MGVRARLSHLISDGVGWLFPGDVLCLCCGTALGEDAKDGVCPACLRALEALSRRQEARPACTPPEGIGYVHAAFVYDAQAKQLIHRLKFDSVRMAAVPLARAMAMLPAGEEDVIVPIPTDRKRRRRRGFDQSALLAQHMGELLGMEVCLALSRTRYCPPQTSLSAQERRRSLVGCMRADESVRGRRVLLVDDVYTTGATAGEAARALLAAGSAGVGMLAASMASLEGRADPFAPARLGNLRRKPAKKPGKL